MPIQRLAVFAVFCSTALPTGLLGLQIAQEQTIPACGTEAALNHESCIEPTSGLRFATSRYLRIAP